jgi:BNR repeat protein
MQLGKIPSGKCRLTSNPNYRAWLTNVNRMLVLTLCAPWGFADHTPAIAATPQHVLWTNQEPFPTPDQLFPPLGVRDLIVHRAGADTYNFLHDPTIIRHRGILFAAWYNCPKREIVDASLIRGRRSIDDGITWSEVEVIAQDDEQKVFYVPNVFLSHKQILWTFVLRMTGHDLPTQLEAFALNETTNHWESKGFIADLFLPNCPPVKMSDGNYVMAGRMADRRGEQPLRPAVAISQGDQLLRLWKTVPLSAPGETFAFPETTLLVERGKLTAFFRSLRKVVLVSISTDCGGTWTPPAKTNFPAVDAKMFAGTLSTGQHYLLSNTPGRAHGRGLLTIAVTKPGEAVFSKMWKIRDGYSAELKAGPEWSYPSAVEHGDKLFVVYTSEKHHCALSVIPIGSIAAGD